MMSEATGRLLPLTEHVRQSIRNILFTAVGTRVQREEYGSLLPLLMDAPLNEVTLLRCNAAVVLALAKWEPRLVITAAETRAVPADNGLRVEISITGRLGGKIENFIVGLYPHGNRPYPTARP